MVLVPCTLPDGTIYFYQITWKYPKRFQSYWADTISIQKFSKGDNSVKTQVESWLVLCTSSDNALYLYQVLLKYLKGFQMYCEDTISIVKFAKGHNSIKNVGGLMVLVLCLSFHNALYRFPSLWKYIKGFQRYWVYTISIVKFSKGNNSVKMKVELRFIFSADCLYICTKFHELIFSRFWDVQRTRNVIFWTSTSKCDLDLCWTLLKYDFCWLSHPGEYLTQVSK